MSNSLTARAAQKRLRTFATHENKRTALWFFKTDQGGYSEHDRFIGVRVPQNRAVAREFKHLSLVELEKLIKSKIHEDRLLALFILVNKSLKSTAEEKETLAKFFLRNIDYVNNWDLVDSSAEYLLGRYLYEFKTISQQKKILKKLAASTNLWKRRISIMTTFAFIKNKEYGLTLVIAKDLLQDSEDLIHKAVGWMIREIGNRDRKSAELFLKRYYQRMPRTMLRYSIEKYPEKLRQAYLKGLV